MNVTQFFQGINIPKLFTALKEKILQFLDSEFYRKPRFWGIVVIIFVLLLFVRHCAYNHKPKKPGIPVVLATAQSTNVPVTLSALGTVTPVYSVTVRTQINGQLFQVFFKEGQMVKAGDLLAQIDPRPYQAQLIQYQGQFARDSALLANARIDLKRYQMLWRQNSVAKQILDTQVALVQQYEGTVQIDQGLIENTKLNLTYCNITAPMDGRIGLRLVSPGNYVQTADTTGIAIINTLNPITVVFSIPEDQVPDVMTQINAGKTLAVEAYDREQIHLLDKGTLLTVDNQIDPTTGTVKLKANFDNAKFMLFPNQFVNIKLLVTTLNNATTIPTAAVQQGAQGTFVYLVKEGNKVTIKPVMVGMTSNDLTVINSGLMPGEAVVTEGADKLTEGAEIEVADAKQPAAGTKTTAQHQRHHS